MMGGNEVGDAYNEKAEWDNLDVAQKSYVVRILNWFHFRPKQLAHSWTREEVLTWELYRAMDVLPRRFFLATLLDRIGLQNPELHSLTKKFSSHFRQLKVEAYPSLQLKGALRNRRSDIEIIHPDGSHIWFEAKTVSMSSNALEGLHQQIADQQKALDSISEGKASKVIALVPTNTVMNMVPSLNWTDVMDVLEKTISELNYAENQDFDGYRLIAHELHERIRTHPNKIAK